MFNEFLLIATLCLLGWLIRRYHFNELYLKQNNIPQPLIADFFRGNGPVLNNQRWNEAMQEYQKDFGSLFGITNGSRVLLVTVDADLLYHVYKEGSNIHMNRGDSAMPSDLVSEYSLLGNTDRDWQKCRGIIGAQLTMSKIKHPDIQQDLANASSALCNYIERRAAPKTCINVVKLFKRFTADVVMRVSFEHSNEIDYESNSNTVLDLLILLTEKIYDPKFVWFQYIPLLRPVALMLDRLTTNYRGRVVKLAEHSLQDRTVRTSLPRLKHKLLDAYDQQRLTDKELIGNTSFFLAAAWDTTAQTLTALMWLLAKHPNEQIRLRDDIVRDGPQSKYLEYCIKETLRLYPPALTARELSTDIEWNGMRLRKGMMLTANVFTLHRSVKYWGHDSDLFRPERFVPEHCKHFHKSQFFAFGMGPRNCVGGKLAMCQMQILVSRILVNYEIELCPSSPELLDVYTPMLFVPMIKGPVELNFIKRAL